MRYGLSKDRMTQKYRKMVRTPEAACVLISASLTTAFMMPAAPSHSLRDRTAVTARRMLGRASTSSRSRRQRARVIHTPGASTSSTISSRMRSSPAISNDSGSRGAGVVVFWAFSVADDDLRRWIWKIGEAACESRAREWRCSRARPAWPARSPACSGSAGWFRRMLLPSEAETARRAVTAAEKTNEVP
jgi:hypothetical protein